MRRPSVWAIVALFTLAYWGSSTDPQYPMPLIQFLQDRYGISNFAAALPILTFCLGACIGTLSSGLLANRIGIGRLIFICLWGFSICAYINSHEAPMWVFDVTRFFTGLFQGGLSLLFLLGIGVMVSEERRGMAVGVLSAGAMLAVIAIPIMIFATKPPGDLWRMPFLAFGVATVVAAIGLHAIRLPAKPGNSDGDDQSPWALLKNPTMICYLATGGLLLVSIVAMGTQFTVFAEDRFNLKIHQLVPQLITLGIGAVAGALIAGPLTDRWGPRPILIWSSVAVTVIFLLVPMLARTAWAVYPVFFVMSALAAARVPPYQALMLKALPEKARGPLLGVRNMVSYLGTALGATGGSLCYEHLRGYQAVAVYAAVVSVFVLVLIIKTVPRHVTEMSAVSPAPPAQG